MNTDVRKQREREFQNISMSDGTRAAAHQYYGISDSARQFYNSLIGRDCAKKEVLELGCGPGSSAFYLSQRGAQVVGIDISDISIEVAKNEALRQNLKGPRFQVMDAESLEFEDNSFDIVCGVSIIHHLHLTRAFTELVRILKPGGTAIFLEPLGHNPFINWYRSRTPDLRTPDEHPLLMKDLELIEEYFGSVRIRYFCMCTLLTLPLRGLPGVRFMIRSLDLMDRIVHSLLPFTRRYSWIVTLELGEPKKH